MASQPPPFPSNQSFVHLDSLSLNMLLSPDRLMPHLLAFLPTLGPSIYSVPGLFYKLPSPSSSTTTSSAAAESSTTTSPNTLSLKTCCSTNPSFPYLSVRMKTEFPSNSSFLPPIPGMHCVVSLFHSLTGMPLASLDGTSLAYLRLSALSGLASDLLSLPSSTTLLIIGSCEYAHLVTAHRTARPSINHIIVYNPNFSKAQDFVCELCLREPESSTVIFDYAKDLDQVIGMADIVCCAAYRTTNAPIVKGKLLKAGAHLDLVGSLTYEMKECDDDVFSRGRAFVEEIAMNEAEKFVDFAGTLTELAGGKMQGRKTYDDVTLFKAVGSARFDLLVAQFAYESHIKLSNFALV
ncbi:Delta(1)-pyrroline-2-carboxylate reductase [Rhynchospora pubera]|uniref:Delta(1)-pyrroline-2-carboxylate reductase n=1 Tax=Rhynchospora pubera TaxID=906938 RepID=A0AAV8EWN5_9POAL|nr:Delta(1)-pyrroline-2-carboxylate reductase [Rhynchospora pubera]